MFEHVEKNPAYRSWLATLIFSSFPLRRIFRISRHSKIKLLRLARVAISATRKNAETRSLFTALFSLLFSNVRRSTSTRTRPNCKRSKTDATISGGTRAVEKLVPSTPTLFSRGTALDARPSSLSSSIYNAVESTRFTRYELAKAIDSRVRITEQVNSVFVHVIVAIFLQRNAKREERKTQRLG